MRKLSIILVIVLLVTSILPLTASAAETTAVGKATLDNIRTIDIDRVDHLEYEVFGDYIGNPATNPEHTRPGNEIIIPLMARGFRAADGSIIDWGGKEGYGPTRQQVQRSGVVPRIQAAKGERFIRDISIVDFEPTDRHHTYSAIRVRFIEKLVSTEEYDYEFSIRLHLNGNRSFVTFEEFGGRISNTMFDVDNNDYVYIGDGLIARSMKPITDLKLGIGNGVTAHVDTNSGELFYGVADFYDNEKDQIATEYPEIKFVYDITTINIKAGNTKVTFDDHTEKSAYFVYNAEAVYVGMSNELLPYSRRYYLADKEVEIDTSLVNESLMEPAYDTTEVFRSAAVKRFIIGLEKSQGLTEAPTEEIIPTENK